MGMDIHAIGQTTYNQYLRTLPAKVADETANQILSIDCDMTRANYTHDLRLIQITVTPKVEHQRSIRTFPESLRIVVIVECQSANTIFLHVFQFIIRPFHRFIPVPQRLHQSRGSVTDDVGNMVPVLMKQLGTAHHPVELQCLLVIKIGKACQRHRVKQFFCIHSHFRLRYS